MRFIPTTDKDYFALTCTTRKTSSRTTRGAKFVATENGDVIKNRKVYFNRIETEDNVFTNGSIVYICR